MKRRALAAPDPRQTSFVVAKADVLVLLDEERAVVVEARRQAWRRGKSDERHDGALAAIASVRDRIEKLG